MTRKESDLISKLYAMGFELQELIEKFPQFEMDEILSAVGVERPIDVQRRREMGQIDEREKRWENHEVELGGKTFYRIIDTKDVDIGKIRIQMPKETEAFRKKYCIDENGRRYFIEGKYDIRWKEGVPEWYHDTVLLLAQVNGSGSVGEWLCCIDELEAESLEAFRIIYNDGDRKFGCQIKDDADGGRSLCYVVGEIGGKNVLTAPGRLSKDIVDSGIKEWEKFYKPAEGEGKNVFWKVSATIGGVEYISEGQGDYPDGLATLIWKLEKNWFVPIGVD